MVLCPTQDLQDLQWYTSMQHVHRIGMAEVCGVTGTENVTPSAAAAATASQSSSLTVLSSTPEIRAFSVLPVRLLRRSVGISSAATHHLQLADVPGVEERNQPVSSAAQLALFLPSWLLFLSAASELPTAQTDTRRRKRKNPPRQRQCFINARSGIPLQCGQRHLTAQIRHERNRAPTL